MSNAGVSIVTTAKVAISDKVLKPTTLHQEPARSQMKRVAVDMLSFPEQTENGNKVVLVICDYFTKWTEAVPLKDRQAATVADALITQFFLNFGFTRIIHSGQVPEFTYELINARTLSVASDSSLQNLSLSAPVWRSC